MEKPSPFDREATPGNDRDRGPDPELAVFDEATPVRQVTPTGSDPADHDLYRRPSASSGRSTGSAAQPAEPADRVDGSSGEGFFDATPVAGPTSDRPVVDARRGAQPTPDGAVPWKPFDDREAESWPGLLAGPEPTDSDSTMAGPEPSSDGGGSLPPALPSISDYWPDSTTPEQAAEPSDQPDPPSRPYAAEPYAGQPYTGWQPDDQPQAEGAYAEQSYPQQVYARHPYAEPVPGRTDDIYTERKPFSPQGAYSVDGADAAIYDDPYSRADGPSPLNRLLQPRSAGDPHASDASYTPDAADADGQRAVGPGTATYGAVEAGADGLGDDPYAREPYDGDRFDDADDGLPVPVTAPVGAAAVMAARSKRRRRRVLRAGLLVALLLLVGTGVTLAVMSRNGPVGIDAAGRTSSAGGTAAGEEADDGNAVSAPLQGRTEAGFDLVNGTTTVNLTTTDLGDDLYRISTPDGSSVRPQVTQKDDRVQLFLVRSGEEGAGAVDIALNATVRWDLRVTGGVEQSVIDMSGSRVKSVDLAGGATRVDLTLPRPDGTLKVRMTGGINQFSVRTADPVPVRVRVGSGAGQVVLDGETHNGIAPGALFTPATWNDGGDRVDLDAIAGMATLTVNQDD